jgi:hypothetical protein
VFENIDMTIISCSDAPNAMVLTSISWLAKHLTSAAGLAHMGQFA